MKKIIGENLEPTLKRILELADTKGINDVELAKLLGLNVENKTISAWKRGYSKTYFQMLPQFAKILGVSADYLLGLTDDQTPYYKK